MSVSRDSLAGRGGSPPPVRLQAAGCARAQAGVVAGRAAPRTLRASLRVSRTTNFCAAGSASRYGVHTARGRHMPTRTAVSVNSARSPAPAPPAAAGPGGNGPAGAPAGAAAMRSALQWRWFAQQWWRWRGASCPAAHQAPCSARTKDSARTPTAARVTHHGKALKCTAAQTQLTYSSRYCRTPMAASGTPGEGRCWQRARMINCLTQWQGHRSSIVIADPGATRPILPLIRARPYAHARTRARPATSARENAGACGSRRDERDQTKQRSIHPPARHSKKVSAYTAQGTVRAGACTQSRARSSRGAL